MREPTVVTEMIRPSVFLPSTLAALLVSFHPWQANAVEPALLEAGDLVFAACPMVEMQLDAGDRVVALSEATPIVVSQVSEGRVLGSAKLNGEDVRGWVSAAKVFQADTPASVEILRQCEGFEIYENRFGMIDRVKAINARIDDQGLAALQGLPNLECLELSGTRITNADLGYIKELSGLRWLYLDKTSINDDGLMTLRGLSNLEVLVLSQSAVRGHGLRYLKNLRNLRVLNLSDCEIYDDELRYLGSCDQVQTLALANTPIRGMGLEHLQTMSKLNVLNIGGCALREGSLKHLESSTNLRIVRARGTRISQPDQAALKLANIDVTIFN